MGAAALPVPPYDTSALPRKRARPSEYTADERRQLVEWICAVAAEGGEGNTFRRAADAAGISRGTLFRWTTEDADLRKIWESARIWQAHSSIEDMLDLADNATPGRDGNVDKVRLQVDARKFFCVKIAPKIYGEKLEVAGPNGIPLIPAASTRLDLSKLSTAELLELERLASKATVPNVLDGPPPAAGTLPVSVIESGAR